MLQPRLVEVSCNSTGKLPNLRLQPESSWVNLVVVAGTNSTQLSQLMGNRYGEQARFPTLFREPIFDKVVFNQTRLIWSVDGDLLDCFVYLCCYFQGLKPRKCNLI